MESKNLVFKSDGVTMQNFVNKLLEENEGSVFFSGWFDDAIIGINEETKSIVYSLDKLVELEIDSRFDQGWLNPEFDELDDDIMIVCQDSILKFFRSLLEVNDKVPPTLYDEEKASAYDWNADEISKDGKMYVFGNEVCKDIKKMDVPSKEFTFDQLRKIVAENDAEYLRWTGLSRFKPNEVLELIPRELLEAEDGEEPIMRTVIKLVNEHYWLGFQDLTFDQWELGKVINKNQDAA